MSPRTPLLRPDRYFAEHELSFLRVMTVVGLLVAAGPAVVYGVGWVLAANVDGTVTVDNPERPPDWVCEDDTNSEVLDDENCDAPREVERNVDTVLWDAIDGIVGSALLAYPLALVGLTLSLHAGAWLLGAEDGLVATFAVAAWGMVPSLLLLPVTLVGLHLAIDPVTVSPTADPSMAFEPLLGQLRAFEPYGAIVTAASAIWGGVVWTFGLVHEQGLPRLEAATVAGLVALLVAAIGVA